MKHLRKAQSIRARQRGFNLVELMLVIAIAAVVGFSGYKYYLSTRVSALVNNAFDQVKSVVAGAQSWAAGRTNFTGVSINVLCTQKLLSAEICANNGTGANPWGGNITVAPMAGNAGAVTVALTAVPDGAGQQLVDKAMSGTLNGNNTSATYAGNTVSLSY